MNLGGRAYIDDEGNVVPGKFIDMVVEGESVYFVSIEAHILRSIGS